MNTAKIKAYAPQARREFIQAVTDKASLLGLMRDHIEPMEIKGDVAIIGGKAFPKKVGELRGKLGERIRRQGFEQVMEAMAYTWFNRFVALRYMELHDYLEHGYRVLSNRSGSAIPEVLEHAAEVDLPGLNKEKVIELRLAGDRDDELYRMLLLAQCNGLHKAMPFLFGRIDDLTELLLPNNLLHSHSPIRRLVQSIDEADWEEVEIIGWIYQFYISEKKDEVIGKVVKSEDIPAATQLFTPKWIVRYMVQNTLGRQWLATYPDSALKEKMEYYIEPGEQTEAVKARLAAVTPAALDPEAITFMDTAAGSGHILVESYDLFKEIYLERGYRTRDIPRLVLEKNLFGLEIDDRAAQLAGFALLMKARRDDRRILDADRPVRLNVLSIQESKGLDAYEMARVLLRERVIELDSAQPRQRELYPQRQAQPVLSKVEKPEVSEEELASLIDLFLDGKTFGSLLTVPEPLQEALPKFERLLEKAEHWDMQSRKTAAMILPLVRQAGLLAKQYHCVVTNPPYMGGGGLNAKLKAFASHKYPNSKSDLFAMFIERGFDMVALHGLVALVTMESWMFLSSYEKFRARLFETVTIKCMVHMPYLGKGGTSMGINFGTSATVFRRGSNSDEKGHFCCIRYYETDGNGVPFEFPVKNERLKYAATSDFTKIPGSIVAYYVSKSVFELFAKFKRVGNFGETCSGLQTSDNGRFLRQWFEVDHSNIRLSKQNRDNSEATPKKWYPHKKGGPFRKWYGNNDYVLNWKNHGQELYEFARGLYGSATRIIKNTHRYFQKGVTWSHTTSSHFSARLLEEGFIFNVEAPSLFGVDERIFLAFLCSKVGCFLIEFSNPTLHFVSRSVGELPFELESLEFVIPQITGLAERMIILSSTDWNSDERSWDFNAFPLLQPDHRQTGIQETYTKLRAHWHEMTKEMQQLEEENNRIFIEAYGLQDELTPEVPLSEITLTCNPHYRYGGNKTEEELEAVLLTDTMKELISYAVGCMMGRYSLDHPGLVYAHSGNSGFDPAKYPSFPADEDGIIPVMDLDWFPDDATHRFIQFLKVAWPPEHLEENLQFIAESLSSRRGETPVETIRRYFSTTFFSDHLKTYKKRPIYWLFSSGREKAFECLVYLHRYNEATLARMRGAYVTPLQGKLNARIEYLRNEVEAAGTSSARKKLQKELDMLKKKQAELARFDEELRHCADKRITLDLDDGVKVNYGKFGSLLAERKAVTGE